MDQRILAFVMLGIALMASVGVERWLRRSPVTLPIIYVALGYLLFSLPLGLPALDPVVDGGQATSAEYLTEFIVIVSLMGAGIAIDRPLSWHSWNQIWPLLLIVMPLSIAAVAFIGWAWVGLAPAAALLLGASLSPTDPVLARSVAVGPPGEDERHDVRFSLTVEAGLNDGLAFPFTYLAIAAVGVVGLGEWVWDWFLLDVLWRTAAGVAVGYAIGRLGAWYVFHRSGDATEETYRTSEGVITLGALLAAYGLAELIEGYGFLAVFVGAVTARQCAHESDYHRASHHFLDQVERIVLVAMLVSFGGLLASGILAPLTWRGAALGLILLLLVRPLVGLVGQVKCDLPWSGRFAIAFLGVRGMGTLYYLAYAQNHATFGEVGQLWAIASFTILASIVIHGLSARRLLRWVEKRDGHVLPGRDERVSS